MGGNRDGNGYNGIKGGNNEVVAQELRCLTTDRKVLSSNPSAAKLPLLGIRVSDQ